LAVSGNDIVDFAKQYIGTPYVWGGNSLTSGVDCSGLVQQVYAHFGLKVPRVTYDQIGQGKAISMNNLQPGDMVFFDTDPKVSGPDHVGLYIGGGKFIEAPRPGKGVQISDLSSGYYHDIFMGGRRISGIVGGGPNDDQNNPDDPTVARLNPDELAANYGWSFAFLQSIPELAKLTSEVVSTGMDQATFNAKLKETDWWKKNSDTMRKAQAMKYDDPATYNATLQAATVQVQQLAAEIGAAIPPNALKKVAEQSVAMGMDEGALRNVLGGYVKFIGGTLRGEAGVYESSIRKYAADQGVDLDDNTIKNQAALIARKLATESDFQEQIKQQAISAFPGYQQQLDSGQTMKDVASPYTQLMAQQLEINPNQVSLKDPLIRQALNGLNAQGKPTGLDQSDFLQLVRNDPRWRQTQGAQDAAMKTSLGVLKALGLRS